jgi:mannose-1-phosphate guanylyltransferase
MVQNNKPLVLILCGGQSLRLWPLSEYKSKNFVDVFGFSPLEETIKRFLPLTSRDKIFLVTNVKEKRQLSKIKLISSKNIFYEPQSKNTAAAILLSLLKLKKYADTPVIITPVDNLVKRENLFYKSIDYALGAACDDMICTLGIKPSEPTPHFGYIQACGKGDQRVMAVKRYIEKPSQAVAAKLIKKGNCFYNSGMFIAKIRTILEEFEKYYADYKKFASYVEKNKIRPLYEKIENIPFDKAIMEKTKRVRVVRGDFFWKDFGSWHTIYELLPKDKDGHVKKGRVFTHKSKNNLIYLDNPAKKILVLGLEDVFCVDTKDFTLLSARSQINDLKDLLKKARCRK